MSRFHTKIDASLFTYYRCLSPKIPIRILFRSILVLVHNSFVGQAIIVQLGMEAKREILSLEILKITNIDQRIIAKNYFYVQLSGDKKYCRAGAQSLFMSSLYYLLFNSKQQSIFIATITNLCIFLFKLVSIITMTTQYKQF